MSVFKIEKNTNYTVMSNYHLRDKNLSYKAKGLLSFMLSLPDDWDYSMNGLVAISKESIKAIRGILQELEDNRYLIRTRMQDDLGKFYYDYSIYEMPFDIDPYYQKGHAVKGHTEKGIQINTNKQNTNYKDKKDKYTNYSNEHNKLTLELINNNYICEDDINIYYYDRLFEELLEEGNDYEDLIRITHYIIIKVKSRNFKDEEDNLIKNKYGYFKNAIYSNIKKINMDADTLWDDDDLYDNFSNLYSNLER